MSRLGPLMLLAALLGGCNFAATRPTPESPTLRLAPSELGRSLALQQRLQFSFADRSDVIEALLEIDADSLRLVLHGAGQVALRLRWDGRVLDQQRADWLPAALTAERIVSDLQLVYWPTASVAQALPADWSLREQDGVRELRQGDELVAVIEYQGDYDASLQQRRLGYRLQVRSAVVQP